MKTKYFYFKTPFDREAESLLRIQNLKNLLREKQYSLLTIIILLNPLFTNSVGITTPLIDLSIDSASISVNQQYSESDFFYSYIYSSSSLNQGGLEIKTDSQNNIIVGGVTDIPSFPIKDGFDNSFDGSLEGYVLKINPDNGILWSTFIGGNGEDRVTNIEVNSNDEIILTGITDSSDFPTTTGVINETSNGDFDVFVSKLSSDGSLIWSTYIGGSDTDGNEPWSFGGSSSVVVDNQDNIILTGPTQSKNFPILNSFQDTYGGGVTDIYVTKLDTDGNLIWSTFLGGSEGDFSYDVAVDTNDNIVIVGYSQSDDFTIINGQDIEIGSANDNGVIVKFSSTGDLLWSTFQGGELCTGECTGGLPFHQITVVEIDSKDQIITGGVSGLIDNVFTSDAFDTIKDGDREGYISKYNKNGELIYSSYLGKITKYASVTETNIIRGLAIDSNDNYVFTTKAQAIEEKINAYFDYYSDQIFNGDFGTSSMIKLNSANKVLWITDYLSPSGNTNIDAVTFDNLNRLLVTAFSLNYQIPGIVNSGSYGDVGVDYVSMIKLDPLGDQDGDRLYNFEELHEKTSPHNPDMDEDGLTDGDEVLIHKSNPHNNDTDGDGLADSFEVQNNLNPILQDTDNDGIHDKWELDYNLNPKSDLDAEDDPDKDGATNLDEFKAGSDPRDSDTDKDGIPDGYEIDHDLDPLNNDANGDNDKDFLSNKFEYEHGLDANNPIETIIAGLTLLTLAIFIPYFFIRRRNHQSYAKNNGFKSYKLMKETNDLGFESIEMRERARSQGFGTHFVQNIINAVGYNSTEEMREQWNKLLKSVKEQLKSLSLVEIENHLSITNSPISLTEFEENLITSQNQLNLYIQELRNSIALQDSILDLPPLKNQFHLVNVNESELIEMKNQMNQLISQIDEIQERIEQIITQKKNWFKPWGPLLTLIQMTQDGVPIELKRISEVIQCPEKQAEELLLLLLKENELIGIYDTEAKMYIKGTNISKYIESMLEKISEII